MYNNIHTHNNNMYIHYTRNMCDGIDCRAHIPLSIKRQVRLFERERENEREKYIRGGERT